MTVKERVKKTLYFDIELDRLPVIEWAPVWDLTEERWKKEGLDPGLSGESIKHSLGLDDLYRFRMSPRNPGFIPNVHVVSDMKSYKKIKQYLFGDETLFAYGQKAMQLEQLDKTGEIAINTAIDGFFWFPRVLFGIEAHFYAFYDYPDVIHAINEDLSGYMVKLIDTICRHIRPIYWVFNEDMAYNHGSMLSKQLYDTFLRPYYDIVIAALKKYDILPFIDCDGYIEQMLPWFEETGIVGIQPLERQAGTDIVRIRRNHPEMRIIGAFDKLIMDKGEKTMRAEFERILPVMRQGGFIPSCDHQVPPSVSLDDYKLYLRLLKEYAQKAVS